MNYQIEISLNDGKEQYKIYQNTTFLTFREVIEKWIEEADFRLFYNEILKKSSFKAYFWEHPAINLHLLDKTYQFELIESKALERISADVYAFQAYFSHQEQVVVFENLGRDAVLIAPCLSQEADDYAHLAHFVKNAPSHQIHSFWEKVGKTYQKQINNRFCWLSTSGLGVYWLHVRIDQHPKYYVEQNYRNPDYLKML